jgi:hypothetical protein
MAEVGGLGGLGGFDWGGMLGAIGQSLLTSPRYAPLSGLPAALQVADRAAQERQQRAAMALVAQKLGLDPQLAASPQAMALFIDQQNKEKNLAIGQKAAADVDNMALPGEAGATSPPAPSGGRVGGLGGAPVFAGLGEGPMADYLGRLVQRESGGNPNAQAATSSAFGPVQFTEGTFRSTIAAHPELGLSMADFRNPEKHGPAAIAFTKDNAKALADAGHDPNDPANLYAAHFLGRAGGPRFLNGLRVNPDAPAASYVERAQAEANRPVFYNRDGTPKTAGQVYASFQKSFGGTQSATAPATAGVSLADAGIAPLPGYRGDAPLTPPAGDAPPPAPYQVAASGAKIPVPLQNVPDVTPPHPNTSADGTTTQRAKAVANFKWGLKQKIIGETTGNKGISAAGQARMDLAKEYLKPTEVEKTMQLAGIDPGSPQGKALLTASLDRRPDAVRVAEAAYPDDPNRQQNAIRAGMTDNRPEVVRLGEAAQDTPGLVKSGMEAEAARKGADTTATSRATALTKEAEAATTSGRAAKNVLAALDEAQRHYEKAASLGGVGASKVDPVRRYLGSVLPEIPGGGSLNNLREAEVARQNFENAIATVASAKAAVQLRGQGPVSNFERVLVNADMPSLTSADASVARNAFNRFRTQLKEAEALDAKIGLHAGETATPRASGSIQTPYGSLREVR